jgi:glycosyltransferase involved in cell wall biosynthesis
MTTIQFITSGATAGGAERQLAMFLQRYDRSRFECRVLTVLAADAASRRGGADFRAELARYGVLVSSLDLPRFPTWHGINMLRRALRDWPADIVQTYGLAVDLAVRCLPLGHSLRIGSIRGPEDQRAPWLFRADGLTSWRLCGYVSNSQAGKESMVRHAGVAPSRIRVIPNGIDFPERSFSEVAAARKRVRAACGVAPDEHLVVTVANLHAAKGHEDIIRAATLLRARPAVRFAFAGEDRSGGRLEALAVQLGVRDRILFLGHRTDVADVLAAADTFLLASHWEGMSNALMEAMCAGVPIVATEVGAAGELLGGGRCGQLIPPGKPLAIAEGVTNSIDDRVEAEGRAVAAQQRVRERYSIPAMVRAHEDYYARLTCE